MIKWPLTLSLINMSKLINSRFIYQTQKKDAIEFSQAIISIDEYIRQLGNVQFSNDDIVMRLSMNDDIVAIGREIIGNPLNVTAPFRLKDFTEKIEILLEDEMSSSWEEFFELIKKIAKSQSVKVQLSQDLTGFKVYTIKA
jgi:hypothetical protein